MGENIIDTPKNSQETNYYYLLTVIVIAILDFSLLLPTHLSHF